MTRPLTEQLRSLPAAPGVYLFHGADGRRPLRGQGEVAALARAQLLPARRRRAAGDRPAGRARGRDRDDRDRQRGRGAPPRAEPDQAPSPALQRTPARRQVVPLHRRHGRGRLPARDVHARAPPPRRPLLRSLCEREEGARDARRAQPRLPLPPLRGPEARPPLGDSLPRLPHRPLLRALRRADLAARSTAS